MIRPMLCALLLPLLVAAAPAPDLAINDVTVVDVRSGREWTHRTVLIDHGLIRAITHARAVRAKRQVDGRGKWLIPGLWDMHAHVLTDQRYRYVFPLLVANGVTSVREMGSNMPPAEAISLRRSIDRGDIVGPSLARLTFRLLDGPGSAFGRVSTIIASPTDAATAVSDIRRQGGDFAKPYNLLSKESWKALIAAARVNGITVEGHLPFAVRAIEAADGGQRTFEHNFGLLLSLSQDEDALRADLLAKKDSWGRIESRAIDRYDPAKAERLFATMRRNRVWSVPTLSFHRAGLLVRSSAPLMREDRSRYVPPWQLRAWADQLDKVASRQRVLPGKGPALYAAYRSLVGEMHRHGVGILAGTDSGATFAVAGFSLHDELQELVAAGLTQADALRSATLLPARFAGKDRFEGSITPGKRADLVLLDADPLVDIANSRKIRAVVRRGQLFDRTSLDHLLESAREAAASAPEPGAGEAD